MYVHAFILGISCGEPEVPNNGRVDISDGTFFEDVCRYSCDAGYMLVGPANRTCQADGQWSGSERICESETLKLLSNSTYVHFVHVAMYMHILLIHACQCCW